MLIVYYIYIIFIRTDRKQKKPYDISYWYTRCMMMSPLWRASSCVASLLFLISYIALYIIYGSIKHDGCLIEFVVGCRQRNELQGSDVVYMHRTTPSPSR